MPTPLPHQREGALFLAQRKAALLADSPRVGKTGASIIACDYAMAATVLVVTKASARAQWGAEFRAWQTFPRSVQVIYTGSTKVSRDAAVVIVGWGMVADKRLRDQLMNRRWDVLILDESHEAKNPDAKRTQAVYGTSNPEVPSLRDRAARIWCLSGTPIPNAPCDLHPMLRALEPRQFTESYNSFMHRYCVTRKKYVGGKWIEYAIKGKNEDELRERLKGFWLRRTQQDVGINPPIYSLLTLHADAIPAELRALEGDPRTAAILTAAEAGTRLAGDEEIHLGTLRRLTGQIKARAVVEAATDALEDGLDKLVLMAWHTEVIDILREGLKQFGVVGIDGRTQPTKRHEQVEAFQNGAARVFVGQILAAGEAIDLSAACEEWFVEASLVPKDMSQAALRITNFSQTRQAFVRFCALEGSIDEALQDILRRKVSSIKQIMEN